MVLNRVTSEDKTIHTPPPSPPFKVGWFVVFYRYLNIVAKHCLEGMGGGGEPLFFPFEVGKTSERPFRAKRPHINKWVENE